MLVDPRPDITLRTKQGTLVMTAEEADRLYGMKQFEMIEFLKTDMAVPIDQAVYFANHLQIQIMFARL